MKLPTATASSIAATAVVLALISQHVSAQREVDPGFGVDPIFPPAIDPGFGVDAPKDCNSDNDCQSGAEYCAKGFCAPYGYCIDDFDCMNIANGPFADKMCIGYQFCNENQQCDRMCGVECAFTHQTPSNCAVSACDTKIAIPDAVSCTPAPCDEDCGGIYYDPMGFVIYNDDNIDPDFGVDAPKDCNSDNDCQSGAEYCAKGLCTPYGYCIDDFDCMNTANGPYADKMCIGYQFCNENQQCDRMCGEECAFPEQTPSNCAVSACDSKIAIPDAVSCTPAPCDEDCGGIYYDPMGFVIYNEDNIDPEFGVDPLVDCSSDKDCVNDEEYCAQGVCVSNGMCTSDLDCVNPANIIKTDVRCVGYQYCNENKQCDRMCGEPCPGGDDQTDCAVSACDTKIAIPDAVSCAHNVCDKDCGGIYFDKAGYYVHEEGPPQDCMNGACPTHKGAYCDESGNCLVVGLCGNDSDCFNPYNDPYAVAYCVGNIMCSDGMCLNDCDPIIEECSQDGAKTIVDVICDDSELTTLCSIIESKPQIKKKLSGGDFTIFAPVDDAFAYAPTNWDTDLGFHIVGRSVPYNALNCKAGDNLVGMINGKNTRTMCTQGSKVPTVQKGGGNSKVSLFPEFLAYDISACNGLVHKMNHVLLHKPEAVPYDYSK